MQDSLITQTLLLTPLYTAIAAAIHAQCFNRPWGEHFIAGVLAIPGTFGLLAMLDLHRENTKKRVSSFKGGLPVGLIICRSSIKETEILTVGVVPQARRLGIGSLLFNKIQKIMPGKSLLLEVAVDNIAAIALYQKLGFKQVGRRPHYYPRIHGITVDALVLRD